LISFRISEAVGSGSIQEGSKRSIVLRLGMIELLRPEGARTMKLRANAVFSGSLAAKWRSR